MEAEKPETAAARVSADADADAVSKSSVTLQATADAQEPTPGAGAGADESPSKAGGDNGWAAYWVSIFCFSSLLFSPQEAERKEGEKN